MPSNINYDRGTIMAKFSVTLTDETEKKLQAFLIRKYPKQKNEKLNEVVEAAVKEYLQKNDGHIGTTETFYTSP
jgi:hypothetical protein